MGLTTNTIAPTEYIKIGGVSYNSNEVKEYNYDGKKNTVVLNNGVKIEYPNQDADNFAHVSSGDKLTDSGQKITNTDISNLIGGHVSGTTDGMDTIALRGSEGTTVDVQKDFLDDQVLIMDSSERKSKNNKVLTNHGDTIEFMTDKVDANVAGGGVTSEESLVWGIAGEPKKSLIDKLLSWF